MVSIFGCPWEEILWAANKKLGLKRPCHWTKEEDFILYKHYPLSDWSIILQLLPNRDKSGISQRASKFNIIRPRTNKPTKEVLIDLYDNQNKTLTEIGDMFDAANETVRDWLVSYNINRKRKHETWTEKELERLINMYPVASKEEILHMFPNRSWQSIVSCANKKLGLKRSNTLYR